MGFMHIWGQKEAIWNTFFSINWFGHGVLENQIQGPSRTMSVFNDFPALENLEKNQGLSRIRKSPGECKDWCVLMNACYVWYSRRRFRPASSVPSPRNCSPLSQTWATVKNDDSSASNWRVLLRRRVLYMAVLRLTNIFTNSISIYYYYCLHIPLVLFFFSSAHEY